MSGSAAAEEGADVTWLDGSTAAVAATADDGSSFCALFVLLDDAGDTGDAITELAAAGPVVVVVAVAATVAILQPWLVLGLWGLVLIWQVADGDDEVGDEGPGCCQVDELVLGADAIDDDDDGGEGAVTSEAMPMLLPPMPATVEAVGALLPMS